MRNALGAAGVLVALLLAPAAQGAVDDRTTLERYAGATWSSLAR
jgi:hypothetical protein